MPTFSNTPIDATDLPTREKPLYCHRYGLQQTASGYGAKLTTSKQIRIGNRWHRVYCICYSNSGTVYIVRGGLCHVLRGV